MATNTLDIFDNSTDGILNRRAVSMAGAIGVEAPRIPWHKFLANVFDWQLGEHVGLIGPTGQGKTTLLIELLPLHHFVTVAATKPKDKTMDYLIKSQGYLEVDRWKRLDPKEYPKRVLWPDATRLDSDERQKAVFTDAMGRIYREGKWTFAIDELWYFDQVLGMRRPIEKYLLQARSLGISLVGGTQRPAWVPRALYTSSTHLFFWRTNDETDLKSISGIGFRSARLIVEVVANLHQFECLYINTRTGQMARTKVPKGAET